MALMTGLGQAIRRRRDARKWSQRRMAAELGCTQTTVALIETAQKRPSLPMLFRIAKALGTTGSLLLAEAEALATTSVGEEGTFE
jgi:transcriptional regulator with XRE-family HTH domain